MDPKLRHRLGELRVASMKLWDGAVADAGVRLRHLQYARGRARAYWRFLMISVQRKNWGVAKGHLQKEGDLARFWLHSTEVEEQVLEILIKEESGGS